jgi:uncharacterized LabA/DUF88 family protein
LLAKAVAELHREHWRKVRAAFSKNDPRFEIFDFEPTPERLAEILAGLLEWSVGPIVKSVERKFERYGQSVITKPEADMLSNPYYRDIFGQWKDFDASEKVFISVEHDGVVFAPTYDRPQMLRDLQLWENELTTGVKHEKDLLARIAVERRQIESGKFTDTEAFYNALGRKTGNLSQYGQRRLQKENNKSIFVEKSVDEDLNSSIWFDAVRKDEQSKIDLFVIVTNDGDHAPHAARLRAAGKRVSIFSYVEKPARALLDAVGKNNVLDLLTCSRGFDFADVWLKLPDEDSLQFLQDIQQQWHWWVQNGDVIE